MFFWKVSLVAQRDSSDIRIQKASVLFTFWKKKIFIQSIFFSKLDKEYICLINLIRESLAFVSSFMLPN